MRVHVGAPDRPLGAGDLRALLAADLLMRVAETTGSQVVIGWSAPEVPEDSLRALASDAALLGIRPPEGESTGPAEVLVVADGAQADGPEDAPRLTTGPVLVPEAWDGPDQRPEPLALRLALLGAAHRTPADLTGPVLAAARTRLDRWRRVVRESARAPSRPLLADETEAAFAGFEDDLDAAAALAVLDGMAGRTDLAPGAVFETFVNLDRILALELAREVG